MILHKKYFRVAVHSLVHLHHSLWHPDFGLRAFFEHSGGILRQPSAFDQRAQRLFAERLAIRRIDEGDLIRRLRCAWTEPCRVTPPDLALPDDSKRIGIPPDDSARFRAIIDELAEAGTP